MTGLTCADEMLYPENHRYLSDLLSYVAVGARSVEDQQHRLTASGLDIPVGMKNPTSGDLSVMMNSLIAAHASHTFLYRGWEVQTAGNPLSHAILRGYVANCMTRRNLQIRLSLSMQTMQIPARSIWNRFGFATKCCIVAVTAMTSGSCSRAS